MNGENAETSPFKPNAMRKALWIAIRSKENIDQGICRTGNQVGDSHRGSGGNRTRYIFENVHRNIHGFAVTTKRI